MKAVQENKQQDRPRAIVWISVLVVVLTFFVVDAGALAWSASLINGRQLTAELFTFFVVLSGAAITVWRMRVN